MPKKGPGNASQAKEKPLRRPCCGASVEWRKAWKGRTKLIHNTPCRGKSTRKVKYHALNHHGLVMELDA